VKIRRGIGSRIWLAAVLALGVLGACSGDDRVTEFASDLVLPQLHLEPDRVRDELLKQVLLPSTDLEEAIGEVDPEGLADFVLVTVPPS
jgi:hypothetical protein